MGEADRRSKLLSLLTEASEIEHGLACSYLFTAFTLKKRISEGLTVEQHQLTTNEWAPRIFAVAAQEMLHLAQAWNLLTAVGGTPYYARPNFPLNARYYDFNLPVSLDPFSEQTMMRFVNYEQPSERDDVPMFRKELKVKNVPGQDYTTVGELYARIQSHIETIPEELLFIGKRENQVGEDLVDFPDIIKVFNRTSAIQAIQKIVEQGEGTTADQLSSHYGAFLRVLNGLKAARKANPGFEPARPVVVNPSANDRDEQGTREGVTYIKDKHTRLVARRFDAAYSLMLRALAYIFSESTGDREFLTRMSSLAIPMMMRVIRPFGEALTQMPAGVDDKNAGPGFGISRHIALPSDPKLADILVEERLTEIRDDLDDLIKKSPSDREVPKELENVVRNLDGLSEEWREGQLQLIAAVSPD